MAGAGGGTLRPWKCTAGKENVPAQSLMSQRLEKNKAFHMKGEMFPLLPPTLEGENLPLVQFLNQVL